MARVWAPSARSRALLGRGMLPAPLRAHTMRWGGRRVVPLTLRSLRTLLPVALAAALRWGRRSVRLPLPQGRRLSLLPRLLPSVGGLLELPSGPAHGP